MERKIRAVYFSPTHGTKKLTVKTAGKLSDIFEAETEETDLTLVKERVKEIELGEKDILVFGFPVYGGRIPLLLEPVNKKNKKEMVIRQLLWQYMETEILMMQY